MASVMRCIPKPLGDTPVGAVLVDGVGKVDDAAPTPGGSAKVVVLKRAESGAEGSGAGDPEAGVSLDDTAGVAAAALGAAEAEGGEPDGVVPGSAFVCAASRDAALGGGTACDVGVSRDAAWLEAIPRIVCHPVGPKSVGRLGV